MRTYPAALEGELSNNIKKHLINLNGRTLFALRSIIVFFKSRIIIDRSEIGQNRNRVMIFNISSNLRDILVTGNFLTGLLLYMNASDGDIGLVTMGITFANMFQIFAPLALSRFKNKKRTYITMRIVFLSMKVVLVALIPLLPFAQQANIMLLTIVLLVGNLIGALHFPAISTWHMRFIDPSIRASFFSRRTMYVGVINALVALGASRLLDLFTANGYAYGGLLMVRALAVVAAVVEVTSLIKLKDETAEVGAGSINLKKLFVLPLKEISYLKTAVLCGLLWSFIANVPGAFYTVYLLSDVQVSYTFINVVNLVNIPIVLLFTPIWTKYIQKNSWIKTLCLGMCAYALHYLFLPFVTGSSLWLYPVSQIWAYLMISGVNLSFTGIPYVNIPKENQTVYISFYSTVANMGAFLGATAGRQLISATASLSLNIFGFNMINKQYYMFIVSAVMLVFAGILYFIQRKTLQQDG